MTAKPVADKVEAVAVELRLDQISRLYNSLDPGPFHEKDLEARPRSTSSVRPRTCPAGRCGW